jgi:hypothetical protein
MQVLRLLCNNVGEEGARELAKHLRGLTGLQMLYLNAKEIGYNGGVNVLETAASRGLQLVIYRWFFLWLWGSVAFLWFLGSFELGFGTLLEEQQRMGLSWWLPGEKIRENLHWLWFRFRNGMWWWCRVRVGKWLKETLQGSLAANSKEICEYGATAKRTPILWHKIQSGSFLGEGYWQVALSGWFTAWNEYWRGQEVSVFLSKVVVKVSVFLRKQSTLSV